MFWLIILLEDDGLFSTQLHHGPYDVVNQHLLIHLLIQNAFNMVEMPDSVSTETAPHLNFASSMLHGGSHTLRTLNGASSVQRTFSFVQRLHILAKRRRRSLCEAVSIGFLRAIRPIRFAARRGRRTVLVLTLILISSQSSWCLACSSPEKRGRPLHFLFRSLPVFSNRLLRVGHGSFGYFGPFFHLSVTVPVFNQRSSNSCL